MSQWESLWEGGPRFLQVEHAKLSTDSVLLADFVRPERAETGIDLGCASGILALLLLERTEKLHMTGLELRPEAAALAEENLSANGFAGRSAVLAGDIRAHRDFFAPGSFDLAVANPPYYAEGRGAVSPDPARAAARGEQELTLYELCTAAAYLLPTGGRFCLCYKPERLSELLCCLTAHGLEPKRLRLVCARPDRAPGLVLVECRRGGGAGLTLEPCLFLQNQDGTESQEYRRIYRR